MAPIIRLRNIKRALRLTDHVKTGQYTISGKVNDYRSFRSFNFIDLVDGSTKDHLQVVVNKNLLKKPELGSYLVCEGNIVPSRGSQQALEFKVDKLNFISQCNPDEYLLAKVGDQLTDGLYRKHVHLRPQSSRFSSLLRVRSELELSLHMILKQMDFFRVHTPTLTVNDSEASSDLFQVQRSRLDVKRVIDSTTTEVERVEDNSYFNKDVFLVTSAQLHLECLAASLSRVYTLSSCFRAEKSLSQRHLCEFQMLEAEEANVTQLDGLMERVESIIKFSAQYLSSVSEHSQDFASLLEYHSNNENFDKLAHSNYIRMTYKEALAILQSKKLADGDSTLPTEYGCDIGRKHEKLLLQHCNNVPIFITSYPKRLKPFYVKCNEENDKEEEEVECFDLVAPIGGEICGGSLREDNLERLQSNLEAQIGSRQKQKRDDFNWYADLRRFGTFPHGGFGIGFERLIQSLVGIKNIKDTIAFPRWYGHCPL